MISKAAMQTEEMWVGLTIFLPTHSSQALLIYAAWSRGLDPAELRLEVILR